VADVSFEDAVDAMRSRLGASAAAHSERVAATAAGLALVYHADPEAARLAGVLHDWDRDRPREQLVGAARSAGLEVSDSEIAVPRLLHSKTGAEGVRERFPELPEEVFSAVAKHTVGAVEMGTLDKIVFIADMIEPSREYPGVEELRESVGVVDLDELFALAYQQSVGFLVSARKHIHGDTVAVWNAHVAGGKR